MTKPNLGIRYVVYCGLLFCLSLLFACNNQGNNNDSVVYKEILTSEERAWLDSHPGIRLAPDPLFPPIEFFDGEGKFNGYAGDLFAEIERVINYKFKIVKLGTWEVIIDKLKTCEIDLTSAAERDSSRERFLLFTKPWLVVQNVIITQDTIEEELSLDALNQSRWTVAITNGYTLEAEIHRKYPNIKLVVVNDDATALEQVSLGNVQATITNLAISSFVIQQRGITNLRSNGSLNRDDTLSIAIRADYPMLQSILDKALSAISKAKKDELKAKWIGLIQKEKFTDSKSFSIILIAITSVVLLFVIALIWSTILKRKVKFKTIELENELYERKRAEAEIAALNTELEARVERRTQELKSTLERLECEIEERKQTEVVLKHTQDELTVSLESEKELNQLKTRFVSMVSHEYRTPLTVILSSSALLDIYFQSQDKESFTKHNQRIQRSVKNMTALLNDALLIGKSDAMALQLNPEDINLKEFMLVMIADANKSAKAPREVELEYLAVKEIVNIDPDVLSHIAMNLISNAIKYSPENTPIQVIVNGNHTHTSIEVIDNGIGIPKSEQKYMFTPFHRYSNVANVEGTGLGMAIIKRCVDLLKGSISVESDEGKGTAIKVVIPTQSK